MTAGFRQTIENLLAGVSIIRKFQITFFVRILLDFSLPGIYKRILLC